MKNGVVIKDANVCKVATNSLRLIKDQTVSYQLSLICGTLEGGGDDINDNNDSDKKKKSRFYVISYFA